MENVVTLDRVVNLELLLADFITQTNRSIVSLHNEMKEFKNEMLEFKNEMLEFKDEMKNYKEESRREIKEMKMQWGALANKMGTLVEDIIAPAVRPVMQQFFGEEVTFITVNTSKKDKSLNLKGEFDVIAASASYVFLIETKSRPQTAQVDNLKDNVALRFRALFPEYSAHELILVFSSLRFEDDLIAYATSKGIYAMAYREWEYMDILNFKNLRKN